MEFSDLIARIDKKLKEFNYFDDPDITIPNIRYISYVKDRSLFKVRNLCAVIDLPDNMVNLNTTGNFMRFLKKSLLDQYGDAFLWKELEMCFVVFCSGHLYQLLKANNGKIMNETSFSLNAMLGTFFINKETLEHFSVSTWGLYFSGDHFTAIYQVVKTWQEEEKSFKEN